MTPSLASPRRRAPVPRRTRRGLGALMASLLAAGLLAALAAAWQAGVAAERVRGHARLLAAAAAAEGHALHHWLHDARTSGTLANVPAEGTARTLTAAERAALAAHAATAPWRRSLADATRPVLPRGWEIVHLVGRTAGAPPDGVLALRPSAGVASAPAWAALRRALDVTAGPSDGAAAARAAGTLAAWDPDRDRALAASRFARLDTGAVLRQDHAGHPRLPMEAAVRMGGGDVDGVAALESGRAGIPRISGACPGAAAGTLCTAGAVLRGPLAVRGGAALSAAASGPVAVAGAVTGIARIRTRDAAVSGTVTASELTACADAGADLCGGGGLDVRDATGAPDWARAAIFGDVVIRGGDRLDGVTRVTAGTGVLGAAEGALTVRGCLRVAAPFVHGAGC